ncbi:hypothetical protein C8R44DRAFT_257840 [Mycena epipterygia]|nr:hypothetical protein C8R44DRAFT_257840 [Mycena epipterygia]
METALRSTYQSSGVRSSASSASVPRSSSSSSPLQQRAQLGTRRQAALSHRCPMRASFVALRHRRRYPALPRPVARAIRVRAALTALRRWRGRAFLIGALQQRAELGSFVERPQLRVVPFGVPLVLGRQRPLFRVVGSFLFRQQLSQLRIVVGLLVRQRRRQLFELARGELSSSASASASHASRIRSSASSTSVPRSSRPRRSTSAARATRRHKQAVLSHLRPMLIVLQCFATHRHIFPRQPRLLVFALGCFVEQYY